MKKVFSNPEEAVADIFDGATIMIDGFGGGPGGIASNLILALQRQGAKNLTLISNLAGYGIERSKMRAPPNGYIDHGILFEGRQVTKMIAAYPVPMITEPLTPFEEQYNAGGVELELLPQGTLAERIRAGGAGIGGFYTPTGVGTVVEEGKEKKVINGKEYILELPLTADFALIRAHKADTMGNLIYKGTSRSFNAVMAKASKVTIVEVVEIVEPGSLDPEAVVTPGIYVDRIVEIAKERK